MAISFPREAFRVCALQLARQIVLNFSYLYAPRRLIGLNYLAPAKLTMVAGLISFAINSATSMIQERKAMGGTQPRETVRGTVWLDSGCPDS